MDILGIIPARGGSKNIPRKNLISLLGKPLLVYTCEAAKRSTCLTRTILSTNDEEIAQVGKAQEIDVPFLRPGELARDETPMAEVLRHVLSELREKERYMPEILVLLQPTSPLRTARHIDAAIELLLSTHADAIVSVVEVPHQFTPSSLMRLHEGGLVPYLPGPPVLRRQEKERLYARNGPAILVLRSSLLLAGKGFYDGDTRPFIMDRESSVDIDDAEDLAFAEFLLGHRKNEH